MRQNDSVTSDVGLRADPIADYGVGLLRIRCTDAIHFSHPPIDHHLIWLQDSSLISVTTRLAGHRIDYVSGPRSLSVYPAAADAVTENDGGSEGALIRVSAECLALSASQIARHGSTVVERMNGRDDELFRIGRVLEAEAAAGHPNGMLFWSSAADALIRHMTMNHLSAAAAPPRGSLDARALERLDGYIHDHLAEPLDLIDLAAVVGCDRFHFAHRFRAAVGLSPHRYVMRLRLHRARERIRAGMGSLAQIALDTGFSDQSHLNRWVRRVYNVRPTDLRG